MAGELERRTVHGEVQLPLDDLPPEERLKKVLAALNDKNPAATDALIEHRAANGVVPAQSSKWQTGSTWDPKKDEPSSRPRQP